VNDLIEAFKDFVVESMGAPREVLDEQINFQMAVDGDELIIARNLGEVPGMEMFEQFTPMVTSVVNALKLDANFKVLKTGDFNRFRTANLMDMNDDFEVNSNVFIAENWKENFWAVAEQMNGRPLPHDDRAFIDAFTDFHFSMKVRSGNSEVAQKCQKKMLGMFFDVMNLEESPAGPIIEKFRDGSLDTSDWNWVAKKDELAPYAKEMCNGQSVDNFPFIMDFVNNWCENVNCDVRSEFLFKNDTEACVLKFHLKSAGVGELVKDVLAMMK